VQAAARSKSAARAIPLKRAGIAQSTMWRSRESQRAMTATAPPCVQKNGELDEFCAAAGTDSGGIQGTWTRLILQRPGRHTLASTACARSCRIRFSCDSRDASQPRRRANLPTFLKGSHNQTDWRHLWLVAVYYKQAQRRRDFLPRKHCRIVDSSGSSGYRRRT